MKALVLTQPGKLEMLDMPKPQPGPGELLVRTQAATICTSDIHDISYNPFGIRLPMIMGHEGAGIVEAVGAGVTGFALGDAVAAHPVMHCGRCASCARGLEHLCERMSHLGIDCGGAFAEYFIIRQDRARIKPDCLDFAAATLMEPVSVCLEALRRASLIPGGHVLIVGDGPFGILTARLCRRLGQDNRVILLGRHAFRLGFAGAQVHTIDERATDDALGAVLQAAGQAGVDSAILCVGTNGALDLAIEALGARGTLVIFSGIPGRPAVDMFKVHVKELTIAGSCNDEALIDEALACLCDESLGLAEVITHRLPFAQYERAFALARVGKSEALKISMVF